MYIVYRDGAPMKAYDKRWKAQAEIMNLRTLYKGVEFTMVYEEKEND